MELIKFKVLNLWATKPVNNKAKEAQLNAYLYVAPELNLNINLSQDDTNVFNFNFNIIGLIKLQAIKTKKQDHAGFRFEINILD